MTIKELREEYTELLNAEISKGIDYWVAFKARLNKEEQKTGYGINQKTGRAKSVTMMKKAELEEYLVFIKEFIKKINSENEVKAEAPEVESEIAVDVVAPEKEITEYQHKTFTATFVTLVNRGINRVLLKDDKGESLVLSVEKFENLYEPKVERLVVKEVRRISKEVSEIQGVQKVKQIYKGCYCVKIKNTKILSFKASDKEEGKLRIDPHWNVRFFKDTESLHLTESELKDLILDKLKM